MLVNFKKKVSKVIVYALFPPSYLFSTYLLFPGQTQVIYHHLSHPVICPTIL